MKRLGWVLLVGGMLVLSPRLAEAAEVCGDGADNDADGMADEGCWPQAVTGVCESPLSCGRTGSVAPVSGQLVYAEPADLSPSVAFGPGISFQRTYFSQYEPGYNDPSATDHKAPMGFGWQHNWMSWLELDTVPSPDEVFVHLPSGQDVMFTYDSTAGGYDYYTPQTGYHVVHLRQATTGTKRWTLKALDGSELDYRGPAESDPGKLAVLRDTLSNYVQVTYNADGQVDRVIAALDGGVETRDLRLLYFSTGAKTLQYVEYRVKISGAFTVQTTSEFEYSGYKLTRAKVKNGATIRDYTYDANDKLTQSKDGDAAVHADFYYLYATAGKVARIETGDGSVGYQYGGGECAAGELTVYFNYKHADLSCDENADCSTGYKCGGETDPTAVTGQCFQAYRCVATSSPNEDLVGAVSSSCATCTAVAEYAWDTNSPTNDIINLKGTKSPRVNGASAIWTSYLYDSNGMPTKMVEGDTDSDGSTAPTGARMTYYSYDSTYPGKLAEVRHLSELKPGGTCTDSNATDCKRTIYTYTSGLVDTVQEKGFTYNISGTVVAYDFTTDYDYDAVGRLTKINGPRTNTTVTEFTYWSSADLLKNGFLKEIKRKKDATPTYLVTTLDEYDHWGNAKSRQDPDGTYSCFTFDAARGVMTEQREAMNGQASCASSHSSDLVTAYTYDTALRRTKITHPLGDCTHSTYDVTGRLSTVKERDDCNTGSSGDTIEYTYSDDGRRLKVEYKDSSGTVTKRQEYAYSADRRRSETKNPVTANAKLTHLYENDGRLKDVKYTLEGPSVLQLGRTAMTYDVLGHIGDITKYKSVSTSDVWDLDPGFQMNLATRVEDPDTKGIDWVWDDLGRKVKQVTPDSGTTYYVYDASGNVTDIKEAATDATPITHSLTYDALDRVTAEDWGMNTCGVGEGAEIQYTYDDISGSCGLGVGCANQDGRLAKVKTKMFCDSVAGDKTFDQTTTYSYDDAGRLVEETIQDDGGRNVEQLYARNKNGGLTQVTPPSGTTLDWTYGSVGSNSDTSKVTKLSRAVSTTLVDAVTWMPFGPLKGYTQENTAVGAKILANFSWNLAYRPTQRKWATATPTNVFQVDYTEDAKGRVTVRDYSYGHSSLKDSYFTYDDLDRITCDSAASGACPTSGANLKSSFTGSRPSPPATTACSTSMSTRRTGGPPRTTTRW